MSRQRSINWELARAHQKLGVKLVFYMSMCPVHPITQRGKRRQAYYCGRIAAAEEEYEKTISRLFLD